MTVQQIITRVDELRPNQYPTTHKLQWLTDLDGVLWHDVILTHERGADTPAERGPYSEDDMTHSLIAPDRFCGLYEFWLYAQMDLANMEMDKYANDMQMYASYTDAYVKWYNREHMPVQRVPAFYFGQRSWGSVFNGWDVDPLEVRG